MGEVLSAAVSRQHVAASRKESVCAPFSFFRCSHRLTAPDFTHTKFTLLVQHNLLRVKLPCTALTIVTEGHVPKPEQQRPQPASVALLWLDFRSTFSGFVLLSSARSHRAVAYFNCPAGLEQNSGVIQGLFGPHRVKLSVVFSLQTTASDFTSGLFLPLVSTVKMKPVTDSQALNWCRDARHL